MRWMNNKSSSRPKRRHSQLWGSYILHNNDMCTTYFRFYHGQFFIYILSRLRMLSCMTFVEHSVYEVLVPEDGRFRPSLRIRRRKCMSNAYDCSDFWQGYSTLNNRNAHVLRAPVSVTRPHLHLRKILFLFSHLFSNCQFCRKAAAKKETWM